MSSKFFSRPIKPLKEKTRGKIRELERVSQSLREVEEMEDVRKAIFSYLETEAPPLVPKPDIDEKVTTCLEPHIPEQDSGTQRGGTVEELEEEPDTYLSFRKISAYAFVYNNEVICRKTFPKKKKFIIAFEFLLEQRIEEQRYEGQRVKMHEKRSVRIWPVL